MTLKELSFLLNIPTPTMRRWLLKPIVGKVYSKDDWNVDELKTQLHGRFFGKEDSFEKVCGCKIDDLILEKSKKSATKQYIELDDLEEDMFFILHNYSLETTLHLLRIEEINGDTVYICQTQEGEYKIYTLTYLSKDCIKFEINC